MVRTTLAEADPVLAAGGEAGGEAGKQAAWLETAPMPATGKIAAARPAAAVERSCRAAAEHEGRRVLRRRAGRRQGERRHAG
ncbi:MAG: hypothetical protein ACREC0_05715, partial [Methylocella sp.]